MNPLLRFDESNIIFYANRYNYQINEDDIIALKPDIQSRGYLTKDDLFKIAYWKAPRSSGHVKKIRMITLQKYQNLLSQQNVSEQRFKRSQI
jgi:hypothetical protein